MLKPFVASWNNTGVNDYLSNRIAAQLHVEALASRPVLLYLNGEYWGVYYIHERPDEHFLEDHLGVNIENVNLICGWTPCVDYGTSIHFVDLYHWFQNANLTDPLDYEWVNGKIDISSFIDYQILELFLENTDWPANNMRCWQEGDGLWRWIFFDGDACIRWVTYQAFENAVYEGDDTWPSSTSATLFFRKLLDNNDFRDRFNARFQELLSTAFDYANTGPMFEEIKNTLAPEIPFQAERFGIPADVQTWNTYMGHTNWFLMRRCMGIEPVLEDFMNHWCIVEQGGDMSASCEVFPNPSSGPVTVQLYTNQGKTASYQVFDVMGRLVYTQTLDLNAGLNTMTFHLPLSPGLYYMKIDSTVTKIILQ